MIQTRQKTRKQISNLSLNIEIINPIESKTLFGGCNYCNNGYSQATGWACQNQYNYSSTWDSGPMSPANFSGFGSGPTDNSWGSSYDSNQNFSDSNGDGINDADQSNYNTWVDSNGDGINDADQVFDSINGYNWPNLSIREYVWLYAHPIYLPSMINNKSIAEAYGQGQLNGVYDALRHALWSALDHHDIGAENAYIFHTMHETEHWHNEQSPSDLINNGWGYNWSMSNGDAENNMTQFIADFNHAVANGQISIIP